jgi:hypothetical protein
MAAQQEDGSKRVSICGAGQCFALYRHKASDVIGTPDHPVHIEANIDGEVWLYKLTVAQEGRNAVTGWPSWEWSRQWRRGAVISLGTR